MENSGKTALGAFKASFSTDWIDVPVGNVVQFGYAVASLLDQKKSSRTILIGKTTDINNYTIQAALVHGITRNGTNIYETGPIPPAAILVLTKYFAEIGLMFNAMLNDKGEIFARVYLFHAHGEPFTAEEYELLEQQIPRMCAPVVSVCGSTVRLDSALGQYLMALKMRIPETIGRFAGARVVVNCANGAAYKVVSTLLRELGVEVFESGHEPNGRNMYTDAQFNDLGKFKTTIYNHLPELGVAVNATADSIYLFDSHGTVIDPQDIKNLAKGLWVGNGYDQDVLLLVLAALCVNASTGKSLRECIDSLPTNR